MALLLRAKSSSNNISSSTVHITLKKTHTSPARILQTPFKVISAPFHTLYSDTYSSSTTNKILPYLIMDEQAARYVAVNGNLPDTVFVY